MGYYTRYTLEVENIGANQAYDMAVMQSYRGTDESFIQGYLNTNYIFNEDTKWYEHSEDMRRVSEAYRGVLFILHGEGEESGDIWKKYYFDGKEQVAKARIEFDEFDLAKLV